MKEFTVTSVRQARDMQNCIYTDFEVTNRIPQERAEAP